MRAALYGAMAKILDVRYEARATDLAGRRGVTVWILLANSRHGAMGP